MLKAGADRLRQYMLTLWTSFNVMMMNHPRERAIRYEEISSLLVFQSMHLHMAVIDKDTMEEATGLY